MADGSIFIETRLDNKKLHKDLEATKKQIDKLQEQLNEKQTEKTGLEADFKAATEAAAETERNVARLRAELEKTRQISSGDVNVSPEQFVANSMRQKEITAEIKEQEKVLRQQNRAAENLGKKYTDIADKVRTIGEKLDKARDKAGELAQTIAKRETGISGAMNEANEAVEKFTKRLTLLAKRALVFSVITMALRGMRTWLGNVVKTNDEARQAIAQLKAALLTLAQPLVGVIIPALTTLVRVLTAVVTQIARVVSAIAGTTAKASAQSAEALNKQTEALKNTGSAAKKAGKSLAAFDEINKLDSNADTSGAGASAETIAPDFTFLDAVDEKMTGIANAVLLVAAGLALWKLSERFPEVIGMVKNNIGWLAIAVGGLVIAWDGLKDAWENGVDFDNLTEIIMGATMVVFGLYKAFGKTGGGIALVVAGAAMLVTAFNDIVENGATLQNTLLLIAGIVATGLGFFVLTGSVIPLVIAGIASVVVAVLGLTGNLQEFMVNLKENILGGLIDFITGVFTGDWEKAWEGVKKVFFGIWNGIIMIIESAINIVIKGINWMITKLNTLSFEVPSWVPEIGGNTIGFSIPPITEVQLPRLASGAVIPPNREFLAVLGDQKSGTNIEAPLATIEQAVQNVLSRNGGTNGDITITIKAAPGLTRYLKYELDKENNRVGTRLVQGGIV